MLEVLELAILVNVCWALDKVLTIIPGESDGCGNKSAKMNTVTTKIVSLLIFNDTISVMRLFIGEAP